MLEGEYPDNHYSRFIQLLFLKASKLENNYETQQSGCCLRKFHCFGVKNSFQFRLLEKKSLRLIRLLASRKGSVGGKQLDKEERAD